MLKQSPEVGYSSEVYVERKSKMSFPAKPSLDEVRSFLSRFQALILHCSGQPKGIGPGQFDFPNDLHHVLQGHAQGGISCSVVKPGDRFHGEVRHTTGSVGLVIAPTDSKSILSVDPNDAGSEVHEGVRVVGHENDISVTDLEMTFTERGNRYNEWVVRNFNVIGLFVAEPAQISKGVEMHMPIGAPTEIIHQGVDISVCEVANEFSGLPIYSVSETHILKWTAQGWRPVPHSDIYTL